MIYARAAKAERRRLVDGFLQSECLFQRTYGFGASWRHQTLVFCILPLMSVDIGL
jgi:hypothetical protein